MGVKSPRQEEDAFCVVAHSGERQEAWIDHPTPTNDITRISLY